MRELGWDAEGLGGGQAESGRGGRAPHRARVLAGDLLGALSPARAEEALVVAKRSETPRPRRTGI
jgi:hypothetical protein